MTPLSVSVSLSVCLSLFLSLPLSLSLSLSMLLQLLSNRSPICPHASVSLCVSLCVCILVCIHTSITFCISFCVPITIIEFSPFRTRTRLSVIVSHDSLSTLFPCLFLSQIPRPSSTILLPLSRSSSSSFSCLSSAPSPFYSSSSI